MKQVTVTKSFSRTISVDYQSYRFSAELTETFEVLNDEDLNKKSSELFDKCLQMVELDVLKVFPQQN